MAKKSETRISRRAVAFAMRPRTETETTTRTFKQVNGEQVDAPNTIRVEMQIFDVRLVYGAGGNVFQVKGSVGDYGVTVWMDEAQAKAAGISVR